MPAVRRLWHKRLRLNGSQTQCFHYSRDSPCTACMTVVSKLAGNPSSSVTTSMFFKDDSYQWRKLSVLLLKERWLRSSPRVERSAIHFHETADLRNGCNAFLHDCFNGRIHIGYSLRPKIANAFFKTSRSRSTRRNSVSSSRTRASNELATGPL